MMGASCWQGDQEGKEGESEQKRISRSTNYFLTFLGGQLASCHQAEQENREEESHAAKL